METRGCWLPFSTDAFTLQNGRVAEISRYKRTGSSQFDTVNCCEAGVSSIGPSSERIGIMLEIKTCDVAKRKLRNHFTVVI